MKKNEGITLIALIITIIILIILTAITLNNVIGTDLIGFATKAAENYMDAEEEEEGKISELVSRGEEAGQIGGPQLMTFTVDGTQYSCPSGFTWGDFVESEYNNGIFGKDSFSNTDYDESAPWYVYFVGTYREEYSNVYYKLIFGPERREF